MNGYLLDTHAFVWAIDQPSLLSELAREAIGAGRVFLSIASLWELIIKCKKPSALLADPVVWWQRHVKPEVITVLPITGAHVVYLEKLPEIHRDPFDRILLCHAAVEDLTLISRDHEMGRYSDIALIVA